MAIGYPGYEGLEYPDDEPETCDRCSGNGCYHDCGEDTCCCAYPEADDLVTCEDCGGRGYV